MKFSLDFLGYGRININIRCAMSVKYLLLADDANVAFSCLILILFTDAICCLRPLGMSFSSGLGYKRKYS